MCGQTTGTVGELTMATTTSTPAGAGPMCAAANEPLEFGDATDEEFEKLEPRPRKPLMRRRQPRKYRAPRRQPR